jgi:thiosulfate/3-mercaptopyruvate sulfurtransferase
MDAGRRERHDARIEDGRFAMPISRRWFSLSTLAVLALLAGAVRAAGFELPGPLVSSDWLARNLEQPDLVVIDVRDEAAYAAGHIPGAVNGAYPELWRRPNWQLLPAEQLVANLSALGIGDDTAVVIVPAGGDATEFGNASFPQWVLRYLGHGNVAVLDGGFAGWRAAEPDRLEGAVTMPTPATFTPQPDPTLRASTEEVAAALEAGSAVLIDARSPEQFRGEVKSSLVARAGHIPGAINLPNEQLYDGATRRLKPKDRLLALLPAAIADPETPIIVYCNTGHWSSIVWFALHEVLGFQNVLLYDGSMQAWSADPERPVAKMQ